MREAKLLRLIFVILCLTSAVNAAQLGGRVVDDESNPLIGVSVVTNIPGLGTQTDEVGIFSLKLRDDITRVTFSSIGFKSRQFRVGEIPEIVVLEPTYYRGEDIIITADRAQSGVTPVAFENFSKDDIERDYTVGEFPLLLETTPNLYTNSDGGAPLGYAYVKIRGFDDKRIATYINGVPLNDPEDQATYFVDLPDFAANVDDIQVQRGVGNSLYGDASFGGSINVVTSALSRPKQMTLTSGYGEYTSGGSSVSDIYKQSVEYSSGLVDGRWSFSGRFSKQRTGGYRENSWYDGWSYYFSAARLDPNMTTELYVYGGPIRMHLSYYGLSRDDIAENRRGNPLAYSNETDNFNQPHYHLHNRYRINDNTMLTNTFYYIRGTGYYEQLKNLDSNEDWIGYDIDPTRISDVVGDVVRQQWVEKSQAGWNPRLDISHDRGRHSMGGSFYYFESDHWGQVVWAQGVEYALEPRHRYYQYFGRKYVGSAYVQEYFQMTDQLSAQATVQLRYQRYDFDQVRMGAFLGHQYDVDWFFVSPRVGANYALGERTNLFANFAISSRTPTDASIYDANDPTILPSLKILSAGNDSTSYVFGDPTAESERVYNYELGLQYRDQRITGGIHLFWMDFRNEIIPEGGINENTGLAITTNADHSVHAGIELTGGVVPLDWLTVSGNFAYNYNRVREYVSELGSVPIDYKDKTITGFPDYIGNLIADYARGSMRVTWRWRLIGRQYMELYNIDSLSIDPYFTASMSLSYAIENLIGEGRLIVSARVDNMFDKKYESSGYGWNYVGAGNKVVGGAEYYPAAERSFFGQVRLELF